MFKKICAITLLLGNIEALKINTGSSNTAMQTVCKRTGYRGQLECQEAERRAEFATNKGIGPDQPTKGGRPSKGAQKGRTAP